MGKREFEVQIDGHLVLVDQSNQKVSILDEHGTIIFRDRIQVAAGSVQGIFFAMDEATKLGLGIDPTRRA